MLKYVKQLVEERNALTATINGIADRAAAEERNLTDTETAEVARMQERCAHVDHELASHKDTLDSQRAWAKLQDQLNTEDTPTPRKVETRAADDEPLSWGDLITTSDAFTQYAAAPRGTSAPIELPLYTRAAGDPITSTMAGSPKTTWAGPTAAATTTALLDVIAHERVSGNVVEWIYWGLPNPVAAVVAEGALKPPADIPMTPKSSTLQTLAHWVAITRQALEDVPRVRSIVEGKLRNGIFLALEASTVAKLVAATLPAATAPLGSDLLAAIRTGMGTVQSAGYNPNAVVLNPADWAKIDLAILAGTLGGPVVNNGAFGLRFVAAPSVTAGTAYVGDFKTGVTVFERGTVNSFLTDSHADNFLKNVLVILAEARAVPEVTEPGALCECTVAIA